MEFGNSFNRQFNLEFFEKGRGDIIEGSGRIEKGGDKVLFFLETEEAAAIGILEDEIVDPVIELAGDNKI